MEILAFIIAIGVTLIFGVNVVEWVLNHPQLAKRAQRQKELADLERQFQQSMAAYLNQQLAPASAPPLPAWAAVLQLERPVTQPAITAAYRRLSKQHHPDAGGTVQAMQQLNDARSQAEQWLSQQA